MVGEHFWKCIGMMLRVNSFKKQKVIEIPVSVGPIRTHTLKSGALPEHHPCRVAGHVYLTIDWISDRYLIQDSSIPGKPKG